MDTEPIGQIRFSDVSRFLLERHDGRIRVYRRPEKRYHQVCIHGTLSRGGASVMVWEAMSLDTCIRTPLVFIRETLTAERYIYNVLQPTCFHFSSNMDH